MKKQYTTIIAFFLGLVSQAQDHAMVNQGLLSTTSGTKVSTYFDFTNNASGNVLNDGEFHFYGDYQNEGLFSYTTNNRTGYVVFEGAMTDMQKIGGASPSSFYNALFNKSHSERAFHLTNDISVQGTADLSNGVVWMDKAQGGAFIFLKGATHTNTSDKSHVEGEVQKTGNDRFTYPIGKSGYYRLAGISAPSNVADQYMGEYFLAPTNTDAHPHKDKTGIIELIDEKEYWTIEPSKDTKGSVIVTLSWDNRTTPQNLIAKPQNLHIVRWDAIQGLWIDEGGLVDESNNTVTTPVNVEGFGIFTLAAVKEKFLNPGDVVIYNGVTPDNDGMNDYLIIDNIEYFPSNHVSIYNRWGRKVYETQSYNSKGNVFKGVAEGVDVVGKGEPLPSGTYYYVVEYLYDRDGQNQWVKKVGYLHLENNN